MSKNHNKIPFWNIANSEDRMPMNPYSLKFKNGLEKPFRIDYFKSSIRHMRISYLTGFLYYASFTLLDILVAPDQIATLSLIRFAIVCPLILMVFFLSFTKKFYKYWNIASAIVAIYTGLGIIVMTCLPDEIVRQSYYAGIILVLVYNYVMIKQKFLWASISGWIISIAYIVSFSLFPDIERNTQIANSFFLISVNILGMFGCYLLEYYSRKDYYYRHLLKEESIKVEDANKALEQKVNTKTSELQKELKQRKREKIELISAKERAEQTDKLKTAFLANMSHEIRTPMNGILGFANLLDTPGLKSETRKEYIEIIQLSGHRMLDTINDLINVSKIEAGLVEVNMNSENLNKMITDLFNFFEPEAANKGLNFILNNHLSVEFEVIQTDKEKVNSILTNLIKNAIKYTPDGSIEFGFRVTTTNTVPAIEFYISDTGIGIPNNKIKVIFERFIQADIDQDRAFEGAGLGLSITKSYVEMLGGSLWVESKENVGSTFYFTLPIRSGGHGEQYRKITVKDHQQNALDWMLDKEILIAEDDKISMIYLKSVLKNKASKIHLAENGKEALDMMVKNPDISLILMDIRMPEMNGYKATEAIRKFDTDVIIIAQTAYAMNEDVLEALASGCDEHISKPSDEESILNVIEEVLQKRKKVMD